MVIKKNIANLLFISMLSSCSYTHSQHSTIFIHGTLFGFSWLVRFFDCPLGLTPAEKQGNKFVLGRIPYILNESAPLEFPLNKSYLWGWDGALSFNARKEASHELYHDLASISGPKTVIGQSHGCNVALNLAEIVKEHNRTDFMIDRLILLSGPVQAANSHLVKSPIFKKVFSLYSTADLIQILDPQALYKETKQLKRKTRFFSEKVFEPAPNLVQAEIIINDKGPAHIDFIKINFMKHLPDIIALLDAATQDDTNYRNFHFKVNIPAAGKPILTSSINN